MLVGLAVLEALLLYGRVSRRQLVDILYVILR